MLQSFFATLKFCDLAVSGTNNTFTWKFLWWHYHYLPVVPLEKLRTTSAVKRGLSVNGALVFYCSLPVSIYAQSDDKTPKFSNILVTVKERRKNVVFFTKIWNHLKNCLYKYNSSHMSLSPQGSSVLRYYMHFLFVLSCSNNSSSLLRLIWKQTMTQCLQRF